MITRKNARATAILALIIENLSEEIINNLIIEAYVNGREQGYAIELGKNKIAFSEHKSTDRTVIYSGQRIDFITQGNIPHETIYNKAQHFGPNNIMAAVNHAIIQLTKPTP